MRVEGMKSHGDVGVCLVPQLRLSLLPIIRPGGFSLLALQGQPLPHFGESKETLVSPSSDPQASPAAVLLSALSDWILTLLE